MLQIHGTYRIYLDPSLNLKVWFAQVAVKEFVFAQAAIAGGSLQRNELIEEIVGEAAIMSFLQHPRILHLYGCSLTSQVPLKPFWFPL